MPLELIEVGAQVPLTKIEESESKVRMQTADQGLDELLASMRKHGQIHAISLLDEGNATYEVVNGHRRFRAAKSGSLPSMRANIYRVPAGEEDNKALLIQQHLYAANMAEPLVPIERAKMFEALMRELDIDVEKVATFFEGETAETVMDTLKFLSIDEIVLDVISANPDRFTEAHVRVLAEYASPATKHSWRMKPDEQLKIAREIVDQVDKQVVRDPRKLELRIRKEVKERRDAERVKNVQATKVQTDPVKGLFKAIEAVESAVRNLAEADLAAVSEIEASDKGSATKKIYDSIDELAVFAEDRLAKLKIRKAAA